MLRLLFQLEMFTFVGNHRYDLMSTQSTGAVNLVEIQNADDPHLLLYIIKPTQHAMNREYLDKVCGGDICSMIAILRQKSTEEIKVCH